MDLRAPRLVVGTAFVVLIFHTAVRSQSSSSTAPPLAPVRPVTDEYYGTTLTDPYRYLADLKDPEGQTWFKAQSDYARAVLESIPGRQALLARMHDVRPSAPIELRNPLPDGRYLVTKMTPADGAVRFYLRTGVHGDDLLLVDP